VINRHSINKINNIFFEKKEKQERLLPMIKSCLTSQILRDGVCPGLPCWRQRSVRLTGRVEVSSQRLRGWRGVTQPARFQGSLPFFTRLPTAFSCWVPARGQATYTLLCRNLTWALLPFTAPLITAWWLQKMPGKLFILDKKKGEPEENGK